MTSNEKDNQESQSIDYWKKAQILEEGRNEVLRMVASHEKLDVILNALCQKAQLYNEKMLCSILSLNEQTLTLHPLASVSLPDFYCNALNGVHIGPGVGSCGTAAYLKELVVVEDINTHPYWNQYKELALSAGVQSCWSHPILGANDKVYGTFAIYYETPRKPSVEDLDFIELSANLAAVVFENHHNRQKIIETNNALNQSLDERSIQLSNVNEELNSLLLQLKSEHKNEVYSQKSITSATLITGFSHELGTPLGNAVTSVSSIKSLVNDLQSLVTSGKLSKGALESKLIQLDQLADLSGQSLQKANDLLSAFKEMKSESQHTEVTTFNLKSFWQELVDATKTLTQNHKVDIECASFDITSNKRILWQVFFQLIENAVVHGFDNEHAGYIHINVKKDATHFIVNFQDDGCGIPLQKYNDVFEPFFTSARSKQRLGLGLTLVRNFVLTELKGEVKLLKVPKGTRYELTLPIHLQ